MPSRPEDEPDLRETAEACTLFARLPGPRPPDPDDLAGSCEVCRYYAAGACHAPRRPGT
jgi:hypothetical protein